AAWARPPRHQALVLRRAAGPAVVRVRAEGAARGLARGAGARPRSARAVPTEPLQHRRAEPRSPDPPLATGRNARGRCRPEAARATLLSLLDVRPRPLRFEQAAEEFEPLFRQVMLEHLRADVP